MIIEWTYGAVGPEVVTSGLRILNWSVTTPVQTFDVPDPYIPHMRGATDSPRRRVSQEDTHRPRVPAAGTYRRRPNQPQ